MDYANEVEYLLEHFLVKLAEFRTHPTHQAHYPDVVKMREVFRAG